MPNVCFSDPALAHEFPQDYLERVKKVHSEGGYGSQGYEHRSQCPHISQPAKCWNVFIASRYKYDWKIEEAQKNILRTHTTAVSARMLYKLAQQVSGTRGLHSFHCTIAYNAVIAQASVESRVDAPSEGLQVQVAGGIEACDRKFPVKKDFGFSF